MSDIDDDFRHLWSMEPEPHGSARIIDFWECLHCCAVVTQREHHMFWHRNNRLVVEGD